jgi:hypothetical protein
MKKFLVAIAFFPVIPEKSGIYPHFVIPVKPVLDLIG